MASIYSPVTIEQDLSFLIIGERTNANGSKAFREAMLAGDWDSCTKMANEQVREGAHVLDVCVDYVGRDGAVDMDEIAKRFATQSSVPLVLDSTETPVLEAGLQHIGGRPILNSANLEDGELPDSRFDRVMSLAREYGAAVICLLIDERGQARDVEWKMEVAHRIHEIATERYGLSSSDLIFDALTFPLSTGDDDLRKDAIYTIEAIRRIKAEIPGAHTVLGVSNVSFGLNPAARHALNSVFLHEAVQAGLDSAIVHAGKIVPLNRLPDDQREVCLDLVWDRRTDTYDPLARLLDVFADVKSTKTEKPDRSGLPVQERLHHRIIDGDRDGLTDDLDEAMAGGLAALDIVNEVLLGGMKVVGDLFGSGQMQLPFVLQSAETMKTAVAYLEPHMEKVGESAREGQARHRHRQGRRARHRQEPRRHHLHEQRLRGAQPRHQGADLGDGRQGQGGRGRRARDERTARQVDADHARQPDRAQRARIDGAARTARRRGADAALRRARPARAVRGSAVLRARCVRRAVDAGVADGDEAHRRVGPGLRAGADRPGAARAHR